MLYIKAIHIIFIVTWFSGLFYIVRLFVYNTEANQLPASEKLILQNQYAIMIKRLWFGITWPSAIVTLIFGPLILFLERWNTVLFDIAGRWLLIKLFFVLGLYAYHISIHFIYKQEMKGVFRYTSQQLRIWNEIATILLVSIVMLATVKQTMSIIWGIAGLSGFVIILMSAIRIYKIKRQKTEVIN